MKYFKLEQKIVNKKGEKTIVSFQSESIEPMFEVVSKEEISKDDFLKFVTENLRNEEIDFCKKNNLSLNESFKNQEGATYKYFWQYGVSDEDAKLIFSIINNELESCEKVFAANKKRTWGESFYKGYVPADLDVCDVSEMVTDDIL